MTNHLKDSTGCFILKETFGFARAHGFTLGQLILLKIESVLPFSVAQEGKDTAVSRHIVIESRQKGDKWQLIQSMSGVRV